jgi:DNA-binding LytR/AlgR family response regulator
MLRAVAIDDEPIALEIIRNLSARVNFIELTGCFTNAFEAMDYLNRDKHDLLFLDIKMPDISGIDFVKTLHHPPMIIFTTAYSEHAIQGFELDAVDYLLKPFSLPRFLKACNKAQELFDVRSASQTISGALPAVFIKSGNEQLRLELEDLLYAESNGNYVSFITGKQKIVSRLTMSEAEALLPSASFLRVHRSYIVAKKQISRANKTSVWVKQQEIPVGASYIVNLENYIGLK